MIKTAFNEKENILYVNRYGDIDFNEIISNIRSVGENYNFLDRLFVLEDIRESKSKFSEDDHPLFIEETNKLLKKFKKITSAIVVEDPSDTAFSQLFEMKTSDSEGYTLSTFCTVDAAKKWLQMQMNLR